MDLEKEIIRRLKLEVKALEAALDQRDRQLAAREEEHRLLIAAVVKFGTMVTPNTMYLAVPNAIGETGNYDVSMTYIPERNERAVRVRRSE